MENAGCSEMTSDHPTVSRVAKSRSIVWVCITDTTPSLMTTGSRLITQPRKSLCEPFSLRRGFKVFSRSCQGCHGAIHTKYDLLVDKAFKQRELMNKMVYLPRAHPAHQKHKGDYFQEWDFRQRVIHDRIWAPYFTVHQAKNANGGLWPKDLSKVASHNPCLPGYVYNVLTGYHYQPPFGIDIPEGKYFNPYFDHMIVGMPQQLYDGMMEYEDGTPASAPQMAHDVSEYLAFITNSKKGDQKVYITLALLMLGTFYPMIYFYSKYHLINTQCYRYEMYAIRGGGYRKFRDKMFRTHRTPGNWQGWFS